MSLRQRIGLTGFIASLIVGLMQVLTGHEFGICTGIGVTTGALLLVLPDKQKG